MKSVKTTIIGASKEASSKHNNENSSEIGIYKILFECTKDLYIYRQFIFYVGTSCDSKLLRVKIKYLQTKIFENLNLQKDKISFYLKESLKNSSKNKSPADKKELDEIARYVCFALSIFDFLESLLEKLIALFKLFPVVDGSKELVNLGFEDNFLNDFEDTKTANTNKTVNTNEISINSGSEINEITDRLKMVHTFKEEFEQMDINLIRYNVRGDSDDFLSKIQAYYEKEPAHTSIKMRDSNDVNSDDKKMFRCCSNLNSKSICSRYKCATILILLSIITVAGIACGLVFGLKSQ